MKATLLLLLVACGSTAAPSPTPSNATAEVKPADGVHITTKVVHYETNAPIAGALVMVLRPGVDVGALDHARLDQLDRDVLARGQSNAAGEVTLAGPVPAPGSYGVVVVATGYEPLVGADALILKADAPKHFDPWGTIMLKACDPRC